MVKDRDDEIEEVTGLIAEAKLLLQNGNVSSTEDRHFREVMMQLLIVLQRRMRTFEKALTDVETLLEAVVRAFPEQETIGSMRPDPNYKYEGHRMYHEGVITSRRAWFGEGGKFVRNAVFTVAVVIIATGLAVFIPSMGAYLKTPQPVEPKVESRQGVSK